jgi:hypothetical protein
MWALGDYPALEQQGLTLEWRQADTAVGFGKQRRWVADGHPGALPADFNFSASRGGPRLVSGGPAAVDVRYSSVISAIHPESSAGVLDGQRAGDQSPLGSVVCPTSIK